MSKSKIQNWDDVDIYTTITFSNDDITVIFKNIDWNMFVGIAFMFNYCLHIALDSFTLMGVPAGKPFFNDYYGAKLIKSGGAEDIFLFLVLLLLISKLLIRI
jgi:membrane-bound metal-dependent hydrolase YbcI (DUF457 family)